MVSPLLNNGVELSCRGVSTALIERAQTKPSVPTLQCFGAEMCEISLLAVHRT
jgi:hypothetical protein